jgi:hypothetical protein
VIYRRRKYKINTLTLRTKSGIWADAKVAAVKELQDRRSGIATAQGIALGNIRKKMQPERMQEANNGTISRQHFNSYYFQH